jgi:hypothetical protein
MSAVIKIHPASFGANLEGARAVIGVHSGRFDGNLEGAQAVISVRASVMTLTSFCFAALVVTACHKPEVSGRCLKQAAQLPVYPF